MTDSDRQERWKVDPETHTIYETDPDRQERRWLWDGNGSPTDRANYSEWMRVTDHEAAVKREYDHRMQVTRAGERGELSGWKERAEKAERERNKLRELADMFVSPKAATRFAEFMREKEEAERQRDELREERDRIIGHWQESMRNGAKAQNEKVELREALREALREYINHQSWRCEHPDRYPHNPDCPCGLVAFEQRVRSLLDD